MPPLEESDLLETAVLWDKTGVNKYNEPILANPRNVAVRWLTRRTQTIDRDGNPIALDAQVICAETIREGQIMWYGELANWNPALKNELMEVVTVKGTPSIHARLSRKEYGLRKFRQKLPT